MVSPVRSGSNRNCQTPVSDIRALQASASATSGSAAKAETGRAATAASWQPPAINALREFTTNLHRVRARCGLIHNRSARVKRQEYDRGRSGGVRRSGAFRFSCRGAPLLTPSYPVLPFLRCWPKCGILGIQLNHCQGAVPRNTTRPARLCVDETSSPNHDEHLAGYEPRDRAPARAGSAWHFSFLNYPRHDL